jgi:isoleucyl-tRNA synthetase
VAESVHLSDWPGWDERAIDARLSEKMELVRTLVSLGLQVRTDAKIKVRQPLSSAHLVLSTPEVLDDSALEMLSQELNVESVKAYGRKEAARFVEYRIKPNFRSLGQKGLGKQAQELKKRMAAMSSEEAAALVDRLPAEVGGVALEPGDVEVDFAAREGFAAAGHRGVVTILETTIDDRLRDLGLLRELQSRVQAMRKEMSLEYTDRIRLWVSGSERVRRVVERYKGGLAAEVLASEVTIDTVAAPVGLGPHQQTEPVGPGPHQQTELAGPGPHQQTELAGPGPTEPKATSEPDCRSMDVEGEPVFVRIVRMS